MSNLDLDPEEQEILLGFIEEGREMLDDAEPLLIELEKILDQSGEVDLETINTVFRLFHSLKGGAGFLDLSTVQGVTHVAETLLDMFRKGIGTISSEHIDLLNRTCDFIRLLLDDIETEFTDKVHEEEAEIIIEDLKNTISAIKGEVPAEQEGPASTEASASEIECAESEEKEEAEEDFETVADEEGDLDDLQLTITLEMTQQFMSEAEELLEEAEKALLSLEKEHKEEDVSKAFRALHSFKGNAGFFGYKDLEEVGHQAETVLDKIREDDGSGDTGVFSLLLEVIDFLRGSLSQISEGEQPTIPGKSGLISLLDDAISNMPGSITREKSEAAEPESAGEPIDEEPAQQDAETAKVSKQKRKKVKAKAKTKAKDKADEKSIEEVEPPVERRGVDRRSGEDRRQGGRRATDAIHHQSVRVDVEKLDSLLDLVGELVISEAMVAQNPDIKGLNVSMDRFEKSVLQLDKITRDIQDVVASIRMIPLSGTFRGMIRLVHELSQKAGKKVELDIIGEETEMDKTVIELINDPLVHIICNSIDHGLETPDEREANGKSSEGHLTLEAKYVGGEVWISIIEDGRGLDREKILSKAKEKGMIQDDGDELRDEEVWQIVFQPGFSTADKITDISGRGVGMDVVRRNIENIQGKVDVKSRKGEGTTVVLRIPLTLAIIDGMLVRIGDTRYTIPIVDIKEFWQPVEDSITKLMDGQEIVNNRGRLFPVVRLCELFHTTAKYTDLTDGIIIMAESEGQPVCLFVDEMLGQQQIVIKGMSSYVGHLPCVSGCTILSDGEISLIVDIAGVLNIAENRGSREVT